MHESDDRGWINYWNDHILAKNIIVSRTGAGHETSWRNPFVWNTVFWVKTCRVEKDTGSYWMLTIELQIINHMYRLRFSGPIPDLRLIVIEPKPIEPKSVRILAQWNESGPGRLNVLLISIQSLCCSLVWAPYATPNLTRLCPFLDSRQSSDKSDLSINYLHVPSLGIGGCM